MTLFLGICAFFYTVSFMRVNTEAGHPLPAPRELHYKWIDPFSVNVSWTWDAPINLPQDCEVQFEVRYKLDKNMLLRTKRKYDILNFLMEEDMDSVGWNVMIHALSHRSCHKWKNSPDESVMVTLRKPPAELVKDFKCYIESSGSNCSWIPLNPSVDIQLSYRYCGNSKEDNGLKSCDLQYSSGIRNGCFLEADPRMRDICVLLETQAGMKTFKLKINIKSPKLSIKEDGAFLNLTWTPPEVGRNCGWEYLVCYRECKVVQKCLNFKKPRGTPGHEPLPIVYDSRCLYEFEFTVKTDRYCLDVKSDCPGYATYGPTAPDQPKWTVIVVASIVSFLLSVSMIVSCYCFKRHSAILCPIIPDPSAIFKDLMMNGNKELKAPTLNIYTPEPEPVEPCRVTLITEDRLSQGRLLTDS